MPGALRGMISFSARTGCGWYSWITSGSFSEIVWCGSWYPPGFAVRYVYIRAPPAHCRNR